MITPKEFCIARHAGLIIIGTYDEIVDSFMLTLYRNARAVLPMFERLTVYSPGEPATAETKAEFGPMNSSAAKLSSLMFSAIGGVDKSAELYVRATSPTTDVDWMSPFSIYALTVSMIEAFRPG
jgi:hypothetical protein